MLPIIIALGENGLGNALRFFNLIEAIYWYEVPTYQADQTASSSIFSPGCDVCASDFIWVS